MAGRRTNREREIDAELSDLEALLVTLESDTAKVATVKHASGLRRERDRIRSVRIAQSKRDDLARIAALRVIAEREGSWVAASKYQATEADMRARLAEAEADRAGRELEGQSAGELVQVIVDAVGDLPVDLLGDIGEAIARRLGAAAVAPQGPQVEG